MTLPDSDRGHADETYPEFLSKQRAEENGNGAAKPADDFAAVFQRGVDAHANHMVEPDESDLHPNLPAEQGTPMPVSIGALVAAHPTMAHPIIDGLLRCGETCNVVAPPKIGKSWLAYDFALSMATGGDWLGKYRCEQGRVLLIDNELHPATLAKRIPVVAKALDISEQDYCRQIDVLPLRGRLLDLHGINRLLSKVDRGNYSLIVLDAWYRAIPAGVSENDNAPVALIYNLIDQIAERLDCAWMNIHHSSKGQQGDKAVTDVGAGAGSQSRAADTHIVLRQHEEDGIIVLDAAVRSFKPVEPLALRWDYPCWHPADDVDASKLKGRLTKGEQRQTERDQDGIDAITQSLATGDKTVTKILDDTGVGRERIKRLLGQMSACGSVTSEETKVANNACKIYHLTRGQAIRAPITIDDPTT